MWLTLVLVALGLEGRQSAQTPQARVDPAVVASMTTAGRATYWVVMREQTDLSGAGQIGDWGARGDHVYQRLTETATRTQQGLRAALDARGTTYESYWILNALRVTSDADTLNTIAVRLDVAEILADQVFEIPEPEPGVEEPRIDTVEWGLARIRAPEVWSTFGVRGEGIVVANIDTGVQYNHPALVGKYRGNLGSGSFDHNYNWRDPSNVCGNPSLVPCDNNGHGSHTMGTMVGDDGGANQIGMAPAARWIAAKGCESNFCTGGALLASAQWILAPTDLADQNPRPDLRPHIVNNSWGGGGGDPWYQASVSAWIAAGIFPAFSNGNSGPACATSGSPGDYVASYSSGAFDINNMIAGFSSRGPSLFGGIKPDIAAPGVNVRSSVPTNGYALFSGTSMASPHTAGAVALLWSAAPALVGDITQTRMLLDQTAIDSSDLTCGGTAVNNNVWGEGRLDVFAAVSEAGVNPTGSLEGTVTDAGTSLPIADADVQAMGPETRTTATDGSGLYGLPDLTAGTYDVTVIRFGYSPQTAAGVVVNGGATTVRDFALAALPAYSVAGYVRNAGGQPIENAVVTVLDTPLAAAVTDPTGYYTFASVPEGVYNVQVTGSGCEASVTGVLTLTGSLTDFDFSLPPRPDAFGYTCQAQAPSYIDATSVLPLTGDDEFAEISLPFPFPFYDATYTSAYVCTNGYVSFIDGSCLFENAGVPRGADPNGAIYAFWDDLEVDAVASVRTELLGAAPDRRLVIEWRDVQFSGDATRRLDVEMVLHEDGRILTQYRNVAADGRERGNSATIGIERAGGTIGLEYALDEARVGSPDFALLITPPAAAFVEGYVTDGNDGLAVDGAGVRATDGGLVFGSTTSDATGFYRLELPVRAVPYTVEASKPNYETANAMVLVAIEAAVYPQDFALQTGRGEVSPGTLSFVVPSGQQRTATLTLANTGGADMTFQAADTGGPTSAGRTRSTTRTRLEAFMRPVSNTTDKAQVLTAVPWLAAFPAAGTVAAGATRKLTIRVTAFIVVNGRWAPLGPGTYNAELVITTSSGRVAELRVPVTLTVPARRTTTATRR